MYLLEIPVITQKPFVVYQVSTLPKRLHLNTFSILIPTSELLITGKDQHYFLRLSKSQLKECIKLNPTTHICTNQNVLEISYSKHSCEFELFHSSENFPSVCEPRQMILNTTLFIQLAAINSWIYVAPHPERIQFECADGTQHAEIDNVGIIEITAGCELRTTHVVLTTEQSFTSKINFSRPSDLIHFKSTAFEDFGLLNLTVSVPSINVIKTKNQLHQLTELSRNIEELKNAQKILSNQQLVKVFHWSYGSTMLIILALMIFVCYFIYRRFKTSKADTPSTFKPVPPKPRRRTFKNQPDSE